MRKLLAISLLLVLLQSCYIYRPCPIKSCQVWMEHRHGEKTFSPRKIWKTRVHFVGEKLVGDSNKRKVRKQRRAIEKN
ncbi:hypothetical protein [Emticicia sp. 17c]|uniref:hypothetical protein n=1 Tax=Emticicia sp. 17c TaxID=3127704 RepID=UPI00301B8590